MLSKQRRVEPGAPAGRLALSGVDRLVWKSGVLTQPLSGTCGHMLG